MRIKRSNDTNVNRYNTTNREEIVHTIMHVLDVTCEIELLKYSFDQCILAVALDEKKKSFCA